MAGPLTQTDGRTGLDRLIAINNNALVDRENDVSSYRKQTIDFYSSLEPEGLIFGKVTLPAHALNLENLTTVEILNLASLIHMCLNVVIDPIFNYRSFSVVHV